MFLSRLSVRLLPVSPQAAELMFPPADQKGVRNIRIIINKQTQSQQEILGGLLEHSFLSQLVPDRLVEAFDPGKFPVESSDLAPQIFQNINGVLVRYF